MRYGCVMRMMTMMMETNKHRCKVLKKRTAGDQIPDGGTALSWGGDQAIECPVIYLKRRGVCR